MNGAASRGFRVGATGVRIADFARLEVFMRFSKERTQSEWTLVSEGSADVWLVGSDAPDTVPGELDPPRAVVQVIPTDGECPDGALRSPLQLEDFIGLLNTLESTWEPEDEPLLAPTASTPVASPVPAPPPPLPPAPAPLPPPPPPATTNAVPPTNTVVKPRAAPLVEADSAFRLKRWPPTAVMAKHRYSARLAGLLSSRPIRLGELSALSNVAADQCTAFLQALLVLDVAEQAPVAPPAAAPSSSPPGSSPSKVDRTTPAAAATPPSPPSNEPRSAAATTSFFDRIRRRLGIR